MDKKDPYIELLGLFRKDLFRLQDRYPSILCQDTEEYDPDNLSPIEAAYCILLWRVEEETRRLLKSK